LPPGALIVLIRRGDEAFVPGGGTEIAAEDRLLVLAERDALARTRAIVDG
jgi:Trk K+ transport system NAD-binding subunit